MNNSLFDVLLSSCPRTRDTEHVKFRVTVGFYDAQTRFFQRKMPKDSFEKWIENSSDVRGFKHLAPGEMEAYRGFVQYVRVEGTPFDLQVEYVRAERQAIFVYDEYVVGVSHAQYLRSMCESLETVLDLLKDDSKISFRVLL